MKSIHKPWGWITAGILTQCSLVWIVLRSFFMALKKLEIISTQTSQKYTLIFCIASLGIITFLSLYYTFQDKKSKLVNWYNMNYSSIALFNIMLISFFSSIEKEAIWSHEQLKDIVSMQWTIFGLSITVFLVWHAIVFSFFKSKRPIFPQDRDDPSSKFINIEKKTLYYRKISLEYSTTSYLCINFFLLYIVTQIVFLSAYADPSIVFENLLRFSFCFSLQTLLKLLIDFLEPIIEQKKELLKDMTVTNHDIDVYNSSIEQMNAISTVLSEIGSTDALNPDEKKVAKTALLKLLSDNTSPKQQN